MKYSACACDTSSSASAAAAAASSSSRGFRTEPSWPRLGSTQFHWPVFHLLLPPPLPLISMIIRSGGGRQQFELTSFIWLLRLQLWIRLPQITPSLRGWHDSCALPFYPLPASQSASYLPADLSLVPNLHQMLTHRKGQPASWPAAAAVSGRQPQTNHKRASSFVAGRD